MSEQELKLKMTADGGKLTSVLSTTQASFEDLDKEAKKISHSLQDIGNAGTKAGTTISTSSVNISQSFQTTVEAAESSRQGIQDVGKEAQKAATSVSTSTMSMTQALQNVDKATGSAIDNIKIFGISIKQLREAGSTVSDLSSLWGLLQKVGALCFKTLVAGLKYLFVPTISATEKTADLVKQYEALAATHKAQRDETEGLLRKLDELNSVEDKSELQKQIQIDLVDKLNHHYGALGLQMDKVAGKVTNLDEVMVKFLQDKKKQSIQDIESQLAALKTDMNIWNQEMEDKGSYGSRVWRFLTFQGIDKPIEDAAKNRNAAQEKMFALQRQLAALRREDQAEEYKHQTAAKKEDKRKEDKRKEEDKKAQASLRERAAIEAAEEARRRGLEDSRERERLAKMSDVERARYEMEKELARDRSNGMSDQELSRKRSRIEHEIVANFIDKPAEEKRLKAIDDVKKAIQDADSAARSAAKEASDRAKAAEEKARESRKAAKGRFVLKDGYTRGEDGTYRNAKGHKVSKRQATRFVAASRHAKRQAKRDEKAAKKAKREQKEKARQARRMDFLARQAAVDMQAGQPDDYGTLSRRWRDAQKKARPGKLRKPSEKVVFNPWDSDEVLQEKIRRARQKDKVDSAFEAWQKEDGRRTAVDWKKAGISEAGAKKLSGVDGKTKSAPGIAWKPGMRTPGLATAALNMNLQTLSAPLEQLVENTAGLGRRIYVVR